MSEFTQDFITIATQASSAFEELRAEMQAAARAQRTPEPGTLVGGRYRVERELGQGGFGSVFEVRHEMLGRRFAMKVLNPRIAEDPNWISRFREEARATSLIGHEAIVYVTDFGEDPTWGCYFVMEHLKGRPLDQVISDEAPIAPERVLRLVHAAAGAFGAVHDLGIVHCDVKPSNVFAITHGDREAWKFLDFGTSTIVMQTVQTQALYGTPKYMAPEQSIGLEIDGRADQFALGAIAYEMLTGELPWDVRNWLQAMPEVRKKNPPTPPSEIDDNAPDSWDEPILRALNVDPEDRFESIDEFARALQETLEVDWQPAVDPMDVRPQHVDAASNDSPTRAARESEGFKRTATAPAVSIVQPDRPPSVVIDVDSGEEVSGPPDVRITFRTRERFVREYRRNLSVGGVFVPSDELLPLRGPVELTIVFEPAGLSRTVGATVVRHQTDRSQGRGFGVHIDTTDHHVLQELVEEVRGRDIGPRHLLEPVFDPTEETMMSPGEGFVLSRIESGMTVARLRAMCAGLPFDIDDVVRVLVDRGWVEVTEPAESGSPGPSPSTAVEGRPDPHVPGEREESLEEPTFVDDTPDTIDLLEEEIDEVLDRVDFYRSRANYLGAREALERAIEASPEVAEFHYRLALLRLEFDADYLAARAAARRAAKRDPQNRTYASLLESLLDRE